MRHPASEVTSRLTPAVERTEIANSAVPAAHRHQRWASGDDRMRTFAGTAGIPAGLPGHWAECPALLKVAGVPPIDPDKAGKDAGGPREGVSFR